MIARLRYPKGYQFFDANGSPLALGLLYYYVAGTTTPQNTYSDNAGTVPNTNPIVLDGSGRLQVDVYLGSGANYKEVLTTSSVTLSPWPDDNIQAAISIFQGDSGSGGTIGYVPAPAAGDAIANKFLSAAGDWATPPSATVSINLATSAATASGAVLTFTSVPSSIVAGMLVTDTTNSGVIPSGTTVASVTSTTVTLSASVTGSGVSSGDAINFSGAAGAVTNLSVSETATTVSIASSSGAGVAIPAATDTTAGVLDATRAAKIDGLAAVATSGSYNDLSNTPALGTASALNVAASGDASSGQVVKGNDSRLTNSRTPTAHAVSHASGGSDPISISASQVSGISGTYAPLASPAFTGTPTAPTPSAGDNSTKLATTAYLDAKLGANSGIATLNGGGKLTSSQIPASLVGAVVYQGVWNAATNTPALASGVGTQGYYYKVSVAGTTAIDGISAWNVGDSIIFDGSTWDKIDGVTNEVVTVAGLYGNISASGLKSALAIGASDVSGLATVATSGSYTDLSNKPTLGSFAALSSLASSSLSDQTAAGVAMFTAASAAAQSALLPAFTGDSGSGGVKGQVPAPLTGDAANYLKGSGGFANPFSDNYTASSELMTNNAFASNLTGWTAGSGWTWNTGGGAAFTSAGGYTIIQTTGANYTAGAIYKATVTVSGLSGSATLLVSLNSSTTNRILVTANGTYTTYFNSPGGSGEGLSIAASGTGSGVITLASLIRYTYTQKSLLGGLNVLGGGITLPLGNLSSPSLYWNNPAYPFCGFSQGYDGSISFSQNGAQLFTINDENTYGSGVAPYISFRGTNRGTIESANALVLRSLNNHFELEGGSTSTGFSIVPYRGGTSVGIPAWFTTDATNPASFTLGVQGITLANDAAQIFQILNHSASMMTSFDGLGNAYFNGQTVANGLGGGQGVLAIANATTAPTANPTGGVALYASSGVLKTIGSSGSAGTLLSNSASANLTAGFTATADAIGSVSSGTKTPVVANGDYHTITNNGAFTLGVPSTGSGNCASGVIEITNGSTPGAVTLTAWSKVIGSLDTTTGHVFQCNYQITPGGSLLIITEIV